MSFALGFLIGVGVGVLFTAIWHWSGDMARYER
jgi:hypothetical protein